MFQNVSQLRERSRAGPVIFWCRILLLILSLAMVGANIYGAIISVDANWTSIVGNSLIALHILSILFAVASFTLILFGVISVSFGFHLLLFVLFVVLTIICFVFDFIILGCTTETSFLTSFAKLDEFCQPFRLNPNLTNAFCDEYSTEWSLKAFARTRTTDVYDVIATISAPWAIFFIIFVFFVIIQPEAFPPRNDPSQESLDPRANGPDSHNDEQNPPSNNNSNIPQQPIGVPQIPADQNTAQTAAGGDVPKPMLHNEPKLQQPEEEYEYEEEDYEEDMKVNTKKKQTPKPAPQKKQAPKPEPTPKPEAEYEYYEEEDSFVTS